MAAVASALPKLQMISGDGNFSRETASFTSELKNYTVVSIIGSQSSGKSYLLNSLFKTGFEVLNPLKGRIKTTKGIWIAGCNNPGMVIMDVEGSDGKERGQDKSFERQSALFSLAVSDVLLLNMFCSDIGLHDGANIPLIETIFKERVNIEATKTKLIVVVRDHFEETPVDVTTKQIHDMMDEIWQNVHRGNKEMSSYVEVTVKYFPHKSQTPEFSQKCEDLSKLLRSLANENLGEGNSVSDFADSSERIWNLIRSNKKLIAADHMVQRSKYRCEKAKRSLVRSLDEGRMGYWMNDVTISPKDFVAGLLPVQNDILTRYEEQTASYLIEVRDKKKDQLEEELKKMFLKGFCVRLDHLTSGLLKLADENLKPALMKKLEKPTDDAIYDVLKPYIKGFADNVPSAEDLTCHGDLFWELNGKAANFSTELITLAVKKINEEQSSPSRNSTNKLGLIQLAVKITTISIGAAWVACTGDPSILMGSLFS